MVIDKDLLDKVSEQAKASPRLRMNFNFHQSLDELCHRMLNAVEPGTEVPIRRHPTKDESFVILRGKVRVTTHNDDGSIIDDFVLDQTAGSFGVNIPKGVWQFYSYFFIPQRYSDDIQYGAWKEYEVCK